jgi:hypothetical protein
MIASPMPSQAFATPPPTATVYQHSGSKPFVTPSKPRYEDVAKQHSVPLDTEERAKHELAWAKYAVNFLRRIKPILSLEDKIALQETEMQERSLTLLLNTLTMLGQHDVS